ERQQAWLSGLQQRLLAAMADHAHAAATSADRVERLDADWVREDVACALRLSAVTAQARLDVAHELARRLPGTLRLLESGQISYAQARALAEAVASLDAGTAGKVEERVLARAGQQSLAQFRRSVVRAVAAVDPARVEQPHP